MRDQDIKPTRNGTSRDGIAQGAAQFGAAASLNAAAASDFLPQGRSAIEKMLLGEANKLTSSDPKYASVQRAQACGNVAESLNDLVGNRRLREQGLKGEWKNTRLGGQNRNPADSVLEVDGHVARMRQDKYLRFEGSTRDQNLRSLAHEKYSGMDLCVPSDKLSAVRSGLKRLAQQETDPAKRAQYVDAERRLVGGVPCDDVQSLVNGKEQFFAKQHAIAVAKETAIAAGSAALAAGILTGTFSAIQNGIHVQQGNMTFMEALGASAVEAGSAATRAGGQAALGVAIRTASSRVGVQGLTEAGPAMSLSFAFVESGLAVFDFARGAASAEDVATRLGQTACSTVASLYAGGAAAAVFGKVGLIQLSVIGVTAPVSLPILAASTAASIAASLVFQASIQIFKTAQLDIEQAQRVIELANAAEANLRLHQDRLQTAISECLADRKAEFESVRLDLGEAFLSGDLSATVSALSALAAITGGNLRFQSFDHFDEFMSDRDTILVL
jgi:hypothetical protein